MEGSPEKRNQMFTALQPYLATWALATESARSAQRWDSSPSEFRSFYDDTLPYLDELLSYLDEYALGKLPAEAVPYYHLALAFAEVAPHCELYQDSNEVPNSFAAPRFVAAHGDDLNC